MHTSTTYNGVAWLYDVLCRLVLGCSVKKSQTDLLPFIPENARVLIVGGGTGWILEDLAKQNAGSLRIRYIDISSKMIERSKRRKAGNHTIEFIQAAIEEVNLAGSSYDVVFTPFLLDGLSQAACEQVCKKLDACLKPGGIWLYVDFQISATSSFRQKALLKTMYLFFRITCHIKAAKLPALESSFILYQTISRRTYGKDFIVSQVFQKRLTV